MLVKSFFYILIDTLCNRRPAYKTDTDFWFPHLPSDETVFRVIGSYFESPSLRPAPLRHIKEARSSCEAKRMKRTRQDWSSEEVGENRAADKNERMGGGARRRQGGVNSRSGRETIRPPCMNTQASRAEVSQSEACAANPDSCKQSGRQTGLEVERLSQIKTQYTDQLGIHMCLFNTSAKLQHATVIHTQNLRVCLDDHSGSFALNCIFVSVFHHVAAELYWPELQWRTALTKTSETHSPAQTHNHNAL